MQSGNQNQNQSQQDQSEGSLDNEHRMYQTLLCSQLLSAENAHCLRTGALNDDIDEEQGGVVQACRLPQKYNALDFKASATDSSLSQLPMVVNS